MQDTEIAVIGAGVVGLSVALRLAGAGHAVTVIAPPDAASGAASGASEGNAGVIADYAVLPVGTPAVLRALPSLLFDRLSPLAIRRSSALSLVPWLLRFARQSLPGPAGRNATALAALLGDAAGAWRAQAAAIEASELMRQRGSLYLYETEAQRRDDTLDRQRALGVRVERLSRAELGQLEPGLPGEVGVGAAFFPDTITLSDPGAMMARLGAAVVQAGAERIAARVTGLERHGNAVTLRCPDGPRLRARRVVLAAGAWSRALARQAGDRVPLDTEAGYHIEFDMEAQPLSRQLTPVARGFYFCPMAGRLRVAGTVELGGLDKPPSAHRVAVLEAGARALLPDLPPPDRSWRGFRPSLPDSLPVIGPSRGGAQVIHAFGHGHLGVTLAPVTARIVADLVAGRAPGIDLAPYRPGRF